MSMPDIERDYFARAHFHKAKEAGWVDYSGTQPGASSFFAFFVPYLDSEQDTCAAHFCESVVTAMTTEDADTMLRAALQAYEYSGRLSGWKVSLPCGGTSHDAIRAIRDRLEKRLLQGVKDA